MFRILVVEDSPAAARLLQDVMDQLELKHELHFVTDGVEALDFLHCRGAHVHASRPNLILLDMNMPRLGGLETLSAIKNDSELCVIPVIMLSAGTSPQDVRNCYLRTRQLFCAQADEPGPLLEIGSGDRGVLDGFRPPSHLRRTNWYSFVLIGLLK
jgi:CheY-like chemotaxis protein